MLESLVLMLESLVMILESLEMILESHPRPPCAPGAHLLPSYFFFNSFFFLMRLSPGT
jgi:hypothetical protein